MFTQSQLLMYAIIGAIIALILLRAEDKFNNKQYTRGQYIQVAVAGFIVTLVPIWLISRSANAISGGAVLRAPAAAKPMNAPLSAPGTLSSNGSSSQIGGSIGSGTASGTSGNSSSAFFTPIVNAVTPKMQYRTNGPTF